ncbi:MAG: DUF1223 domain-containing protein [Chitinophagaceae bacterium]
MKLFIMVCTVSIAAIALSFTYHNFSDKNFRANENSSSGFAVIELFTSEGCSSCPPADNAVANLLTEYKRNVYILGYHVDYWNRLGWKDIYSDAAYSSRQTKYSEIFKMSSVYTPQIVVNGKEQFVGSDEVKLHNSIDRELKEMPTENLGISSESKDDKTVEVNYKTDNVSDNLNIALIQSHAQSNVQRGENSGATLHHVNVVRELKTINLKLNQEGSTTLNLPQGLSAKDCSVIAFIQNENNGKIIAAAKTNIE